MARFDGGCRVPYDEKTSLVVSGWSLVVRRAFTLPTVEVLANDQRLRTNDDFPFMRIAYLECFSGMSGDMFLGALVDAGVPAGVLEEAVAALDVGARLEISRVVRSGISATKVDVWVEGKKDLPREEYWERAESEHHHEPSEHSREGTHGLGHHGHPHSHAGESSRAGAPAPHEHGRGLMEIRQIISAASISEGAKKTAISIFEALGRAEAKIHNTSIEGVHFHEVGAVDAMVDIVCAAVGAEALGVDKNVGSLAVGKYADFAVLDRDWMRAEPEAIMATRFLATYSSGREVYAAPLSSTAYIAMRPRRRGGSCCGTNA